MVGQKLVWIGIVWELGFLAQIILCHLAQFDLQKVVFLIWRVLWWFTSGTVNGYVASGAVYGCFA